MQSFIPLSSHNSQSAITSSHNQYRKKQNSERKKNDESKTNPPTPAASPAVSETPCHSVSLTSSHSLGRIFSAEKKKTHRKTSPLPFTANTTYSHHPPVNSSSRKTFNHILATSSGGWLARPHPNAASTRRVCPWDAAMRNTMRILSSMADMSAIETYLRSESAGLRTGEMLTTEKTWKVLGSNPKVEGSCGVEPVCEMNQQITARV